MAAAVSGIYAVVNSVNGKRYYGSSANVWSRKRQHFHKLRSGCHHNAHLQSAWDLYGEASFEFLLIEIVAVEDLLQVEQSYLDRNSDGYNVSQCAESAARGVRWSQEARVRVSASRRGRRLSDSHKKALSAANKGIAKSAAEVRLMSERQMGRRLDDSVKLKISSSVRGLWRDGDYRERVIAAQTNGKQTPGAKQNYSAASALAWSDPKYARKMSAARKRIWNNPEFAAKMLTIRKIQGQKLRERNAQKMKEIRNALP